MARFARLLHVQTGAIGAANNPLVSRNAVPFIFMGSVCHHLVLWSWRLPRALSGTPNTLRCRQKTGGTSHIHGRPEASRLSFTSTSIVICRLQFCSFVHNLAHPLQENIGYEALVFV